MKKAGLSIDQMLATLPKAELAIVNRLRSLITECLPKASEEPKYGVGVPFYVRNRMICFIWPSSVYWGLKRKAEAKQKLVTLGFCQGNLMSNESGLLEAEGRKQVYCLYINSIREIYETQIRAWLYEAELIDDDFGRKKKAKKRKR